ncbi:low temperature requirement protein A [Pyxidicoccus parkwayensis]|uniref:Low temperature requirement protein A n=1 Tax=Pyxidicoccus parkwayensis TaxID=2813578 RepID=A0ABX7P1Z9_9BACT|nr:low temperature requirement protein A [Pyxidicoccus parkwaysis]QSQ22883.1 low temperature requirement protein A [Pyxidicoccus parkwaysis]
MQPPAALPPQVPTLRTGELAHPERRATWTELFFDLMYVVAIARLAHELKQTPTLLGAAAFAGLFVPVWWSWIGVTFYADRFDSDDTADRLLLALQMLAMAALAVQIHDGTGVNAPGYALAYCVLRLLLVLQYARAWRHIPIARPLTRRYMCGFSLAVLPWLASVFTPPPLRYFLWAAGLVMDLATPLLSRPQQAALPLSPAHLPERFGLFTLIVLGESMVAVVSGVAGQHWAAASVLTAVLSFAFAFGMWWLYFDNVSHSFVHRGRLSGQAWVYIHLLLMMGLTASGAGAERVIASLRGQGVTSAARWLFCAATASCFASLAVILLTSSRPFRLRRRHDLRPELLLTAAGVMLLVAALGEHLPAFALTGSAGGLAVIQFVAAHPRKRASAQRPQL